MSQTDAQQQPTEDVDPRPKLYIGGSALKDRNLIRRILGNHVLAHFLETEDASEADLIILNGTFDGWKKPLRANDRMAKLWVIIHTVKYDSMDAEYRAVEQRISKLHHITREADALGKTRTKLHRLLLKEFGRRTIGLPERPGPEGPGKSSKLKTGT